MAVGLIIFTTGLALFAYTGLFARLWADDYCYSSFIKIYGWWAGIVKWYITSGARFSTIATVGIVDIFGTAETSLQPGLLILFWALAFYMLVLQTSRAAGWKIGKAWLLLISLVQVYFAVLLAPDRTQTIYWRVATLHYSFPVPWLMAHIALSIQYLRSGARGRVWPFILAGVSAFYNAGQSETTAFMQAAVFAVGSLAGWLLLKGRVRSQALGLSAISLAATLTVMIIMFLAPVNDRYLQGMQPPDNLLLIIPVAFRYVFDFIFYAIRGQFVPYLAFFGANLAVSLVVQADNQIKLPTRAWLTAAALTLAFMVVFMFSSFVPSTYANLQYPGARALMPGSYLLLLGLGLGAFCLAGGLQNVFQSVGAGWLKTSALLLLALAVLYPLRPLPYLLGELKTMSVWAERWDARDQEIRGAKANGVMDVQTRQFEVVRGLEDMGPNPDVWVNACAAYYYGVNSITAIP